MCVPRVENRCNHESPPIPEMSGRTMRCNRVKGHPGNHTYIHKWSRVGPPYEDPDCWNKPVFVTITWNESWK